MTSLGEGETTADLTTPVKDTMTTLAAHEVTLSAVEEAVVRDRSLLLGSLAYKLALQHNGIIDEPVMEEATLRATAVQLIHDLGLEQLIEIKTPIVDQAKSDVTKKTDIVIWAPLIEQALSAQDLSMRSLGGMVGYSHTTIGKVCRGEASWEATRKVALFLGLINDPT